MNADTTGTAAHLVVDGLRFAYPRQPVFADWSRTFAPGLTWIRGDNGSGKSTLLQLLGGALDPGGGTIRHAGLDGVAQPLDYRRRVYWCGPDGPAFDHLKPAELFGFVENLYPRFDRAIVSTWIDAFGLEPFLPRRIDQLSTGSRRKVAVTAALAAQTDVVLLDEPMAGLDHASLRAFRAWLETAATRDDRIVVVASHEPLGAAEGSATIVDLPRVD